MGHVEEIGRLSGTRIHISFDSDRSLLEDVQERINRFLEKGGISEGTIRQLEIISEEIMVNICHYAYPDGNGPVDVEYSIGTSDIVAEFRDSGVPFDPVSKGEVSRDGDPSDWPIGGLGIHIVLKMADSVEYRYESGQNVLTVSKRFRSFAAGQAVQ